jgi:hypothetical protein
VALTRGHDVPRRQNLARLAEPLALPRRAATSGDWSTRCRKVEIAGGDGVYASPPDAVADEIVRVQAQVP